MKGDPDLSWIEEILAIRQQLGVPASETEAEQTLQAWSELLREQGEVREQGSEDPSLRSDATERLDELCGCFEDLLACQDLPLPEDLGEPAKSNAATTSPVSPAER